MNSQTVSKLIRAEIWPVLRAQGFSKFEGKSAYRYRDSVISVVNFQSFSSDLASKLRCTTFSFAINLGVYLVSGVGEQRVRRDKQGRLMPYEYECPFREHLRKRSAIDGFERPSIFYVDNSGSTIAACIREACFLLNEVAPLWFDLFADLSRVVGFLETTGKLPFVSDQLKGPTGNLGSQSWHESVAELKLLLHRRTRLIRAKKLCSGRLRSYSELICRCQVCCAQRS